MPALDSIKTAPSKVGSMVGAGKLRGVVPFAGKRVPVLGTTLATTGVGLLVIYMVWTRVLPMVT